MIEIKNSINQILWFIFCSLFCRAPRPVHYLSHTRPIPVPYPSHIRPIPLPYPSHTPPIPVPYPSLTHPLPVPYRSLTCLASLGLGKGRGQTLYLIFLYNRLLQLYNCLTHPPINFFKTIGCHREPLHVPEVSHATSSLTPPHHHLHHPPLNSCLP